MNPQRPDLAAAFKAALGANEGLDWTRRIEDAGYVVLQAA